MFTNSCSKTVPLSNHRTQSKSYSQLRRGGSMPSPRTPRPSTPSVASSVAVLFSTRLGLAEAAA